MSSVQDFINGIMATTAATAKQNHWTPGGFGNNVAQGVGGLVGGAANLVDLFSATNPVREVLANPQAAGPMATKFLQSLGTSVNNTVGQPINPKTMQLQTPSLSEAENFAYNKPVDVATNLAMGAGAAAKVAKAGGLLSDAGAAGEAGNITKAAAKIAPKSPPGWQSIGMKNLGLPPIGGMNIVPKTAEELSGTAAKQAANATAGISDIAANTFLKAFPVRREIGKNINQLGVAKQMINDGIRGDVPTINNNVQTILDHTENMKRAALGNISGGVDISNAQKVVSDGLKNVPELAGKEAKMDVYRQQLNGYLPKNASINGSVDPLDAYDSMKNIRNLGYDLVEQGKDVYGRTINAEKVNMGKVYIDTAKELNDSLDQTLKNQPLFSNMANDPKAVSAIANVSPQVADRLKSVQGWKDMQALQKPYVDMSHMGKEAQDFTNTPGAHLVGQITDAMTKGGGGALGFMGSGGNVAGLVGGSLAGQIASPFIQQAVEKFMPQIMTGAAGTINKLQQGGLGGLPSLPGLAKPSLAGVVESALNQPGQQTPRMKASQPSTTGKTLTQQAPSNITPFYQNKTPDQSGHYQIDTTVDPSQRPMTYQDFVTQTAGLSTNDPAYTKIKNQYEMEQNLIKNGVPENIQGFMRNAVPIQKNANIIADNIGNGTFPMGVINHFDNLNDAAKYVDPKYQGFVTGLDGLNNGFEELYQSSTGEKPSNNMLISPKDSQQQALTKLSYMTNFFSGTYDEYKGIYSAMSPSGTVSPQSGQIQPAAIPVNNAPTSGIDPNMVQQNFPNLPPLGQAIGQ